LKTNSLFLCAAVVLLLLNSACDPAALLGKLTGKTDKSALRATYDRGNCYGRCEVYSLELYDNGRLLFKGVRFTDKPGTWENKIDRRRLAGLLDSFDRADFPNYPPGFRATIPDAATVDIGYYDAEGTYFKTSFKDVVPAELGALSRTLYQLAHLPGYRLISETITDPEPPQQPVADGAREEIIVHLAPGVVAEKWVLNYGKQNVRIKERISPRGSYFVITSDPNIMPAEELLGFLRQDADVVSAQRNGKVGPR